MGTAAIIYDLDGTLVDSCPGIETAFRRAAGAVLPGREVPALRPHIGPPIRGIATSVFGPLEEEALAGIERLFREIYDGETCLECELFPKVATTLEQLSARGIRQFVVTNKPQLPTERVLARLGLTRWIERFVAPDSVAPRFSSKALATTYLLQTTGLAPEDCLFVGDSPDDEEAARHNGMPFLGVAYGYGSARLPSAPALLSSFSLLPESLGFVLRA